MQFFNIGDDSGDIEVQFSMRLFEFLNRFGDINAIDHNYNMTSRFRFNPMSDHMILIGPELKEFISKEAGGYLAQRVRQSLVNACRTFNDQMNALENQHKPNINPANTIVSWYMSQTDATLMKLRFG